MKMVLEFNMDNATFADDPDGEVLRILDVCAGRIASGQLTTGRLSDSNGNFVGGYRFLRGSIPERVLRDRY